MNSASAVFVRLAHLNRPDTRSVFWVCGTHFCKKGSPVPPKNSYPASPFQRFRWINSASAVFVRFVHLNRPDTRSVFWVCGTHFCKKGFPAPSKKLSPNFAFSKVHMDELSACYIRAPYPSEAAEYAKRWQKLAYAASCAGAETEAITVRPVRRSGQATALPAR